MMYENDARRGPAGPLAGIFMILIGIGCLGGAYWFGMKTHDLLTHGLHAQGEVISVQEELRTETRHQQGFGDMTVRHKVYFPMVRFEDSHHRKAEFKSSASTDSPVYRKGDVVGVIYMADDPTRTAIIDEGGWNWVIPGALGAMGLVFIGSGLWAILGV
jgi:hypothetical protein